MIFFIGNSPRQPERFSKTKMISLKRRNAMAGQTPRDTQNSHLITMFMCGDVMTGRGIDQVLPYEITREERSFAYRLVDFAAIDVVHGHSSHHPKAIEVYAGKPVLYGCGDFLNDYEGIGGYEQFRGDLGLMYLVSMDPMSRELVDLCMIPAQIRHFRINQTSPADAVSLPFLPES
jgi:poly-gamma-glutamate capsule biosynthesis protein CapA/YwtB (metallophosphatase superfamily)